MSQNHVALLVTCLVDQILPQIGVAAVKLLRRAGCDVHFPPEQTCCGQPFFNSGFRTETEKLARRTIDIFADQPAVVLPSGSCTTMLRAEYPHLFAADPAYREKAAQLAAKTYELSEFLVHQAQWQPAVAADAARPVTYHDSCHMCRTLGLSQEPRQLLQATGHAVNEMAESDRCCGFGGLFSLRLPEGANAMTVEKLRQAAAADAATLVTADPGCLMQMQGMIEDETIQIEHLAIRLEAATR